MVKRILAFLLAVLMLCSLAQAETLVDSAGSTWHFGFGKCDIIPDTESEAPLYIAGYENGEEITGILDLCQARAVWLDAGGEGVLLIGIDCVALTSGTVAKIRAALSDLPNCAAINVYSTHTHAGIDTLGLWGPVGLDGKNDAYMESLISAAEAAGRDAFFSRREGKMHYGSVETVDMYRDSRDPIVTDPNLYSGTGLRTTAKNQLSNALTLIYLLVTSNTLTSMILFRVLSNGRHFR